MSLNFFSQLVNGTPPAMRQHIYSRRLFGLFGTIEKQKIETFCGSQGVIHYSTTGILYPFGMDDAFVCSHLQEFIQVTYLHKIFSLRIHIFKLNY